MNEKFLKDLAAWLESEALAFEHGITVFSGNLPNTDADAVALVLYGASRGVYVMDTEDAKPVAVRPLVQCITRFADFDEGMRIAFVAHNALIKMTGVVWEGVRIVNVDPLQSVPFYVGDTESGLPMFSCNYEIEVEA